jgi:hypothetical protein
VTDAQRTAGIVRLGTDGIVFQRKPNDRARRDDGGCALGAGWTPAQLVARFRLRSRRLMLALQQFAERTASRRRAGNSTSAN